MFRCKMRRLGCLLLSLVMILTCMAPVSLATEDAHIHTDAQQPETQAKERPAVKAAANVVEITSGTSEYSF